MNQELWLEAGLRAGALPGLGLGAARLVRGAEARRLVLLLALGASVAAPAVTWVSRTAAPSAQVRLPRLPFAEPTPMEAPVLSGALTAGAPLASGGAAPRPEGVRWSPGLGAVWALGALWLLTRGVVSLGRTRALARRASPLDPERAAQVCGQAGGRALIRVTDELETPAVAGLFRPVILMPRSALGWSPQRWRAVLLHELAHVRRGDTRGQFLGTVACALYWPLPLVWMAAREFRRACEFAADEAALAAGETPSAYAEHLLAVATGRPAPAAALGVASRPSELGQRIEAVVAPGARPHPLTALRALALQGTAASLLGLVACAGSEPSAQPSTSPAAAAPATAVAKVEAQEAGTDSTIVPSLQALAEQEVRKIEQEHAGRATIVAIEPATGFVVAMAGSLARAASYEPGSTIKPITVAIALDTGAITAQQSFFCEQGARAYGSEKMRDASPHGQLDVGEILAVSSNIGTSKIYDQLGGERLIRGFERFHLGEALSGVPASPLPPVPADRSLQGAVLSLGVNLTVSPLRLAAAYAALASGGQYRTPVLRRSEATAPQRVVSEASAQAVVKMLEGTVQGEQGTGKLARVNGVRVAGKTGTVNNSASAVPDRTTASFVGIVPADKPRLVILVGVEAKGASITGGNVAAPAFARLASQLPR